MAPPKPDKFFLHQPRAPHNTANFPAAITDLVFTGHQNNYRSPTIQFWKFCNAQHIIRLSSRVPPL
jgi:hypothetical protein